ncbi:MAG: hypothetical protein EON98_06715 [Chitinophagaceae bacterium]|nr:MAG: hypothetical protein EON98_06715 [Chitinophagaceae bacterium]
MDWRENINTLKEIYPGHFQIILDFATVDFLKFVLSDEYKYVWVYSHETKCSLDWKSYKLPLFDNQNYQEVLARQIRFDFIVPTTDFRALLPSFGPGITLTQLNELPKYYLNSATVKGKSRYDLLSKECDYLFEIDIPSATDYGTLVSSDKSFLQSLLDNQAIDWKSLP